MNDKIYNIDLKKKIYFGHPINTYDTELERQLLRIISLHFPDFSIENPNQKHHQEGYRHYKETMGSGMRYFYELILPSCSAGIFLPFRDGKWGAGVFGEARALETEKCRVYEINFLGNIKSPDLKTVIALNIPETQKRIRNEKGEIIPY